MGNSTGLDQNFGYFSEELCSRADDALRMGYLIYLDREIANNMVRNIYKSFAENLANTRKEESISRLIFKEAWVWLKSNHDLKASESRSELKDIFQKLSHETRAIMGAVDFLGLSVSETCECTELNEEAVREHLLKGREILLKKNL